MQIQSTALKVNTLRILKKPDDDLFCIRTGRWEAWVRHSLSLIHTLFVTLPYCLVSLHTVLVIGGRLCKLES
jgi:hypothetical protein